MKKLLLDFYTKAPFSLGNVLYKQCDGVSIWLFLGPVLVNTILTEF